MSDNIKEIVARNLQYYRKKNKITQKELADKLGVKHNAISSWENAVNSIDIDSLFRVCKIFGITVNDMYGMTDTTPTTIAAHKDGDNFTDDELEKIEEYKKLLLAARPKED